MKEGIDAVIVDSVLKIRNGLTKHATKPTGPVATWTADGSINGVTNTNDSGI